MTTRFAWNVVITMLALSLGCSGDDSYVSVGDRADRELPGMDPMDGSTMDGSGGDGDGDGDGSITGDGSMSGDGSFLDSVDLPDGSIVLDDGAVQLPDGEVIDQETAEMRYGMEIDVTTCELSELDDIAIPVTFGDEGGFSIAASGSSGFGIAVNQNETNCPTNVGVAVLPSMGALPSPKPLLPGCKVARDVAMLGIVGGYHLAWVDNSTETAELHRIMLDRDMKTMGGFERITITDSADELEVRPVLGTISERSLLAWITRNSVTKQEAIMGKFLDGEDTETFALVEAGANHDPQGLAITPISIENRGEIAWVGPQTAPGVWVLPLDETGHPDGSPIKLTDRVGASSSVDLAPRIDGGGAVYSIVIDSIPQVRFRRLDYMGQPRGDERVLISTPQRAQDASIAGLGGGYAVAYRVLPSSGDEGAEIRLTFISKEGNVTRDAQGRVVSYKIGDSTLSSGRTQVEVSLDGVLMIGWLDAADSGTSGNVLKVARRSLTCAL